MQDWYPDKIEIPNLLLNLFNLILEGPEHLYYVCPSVAPATSIKLKDIFGPTYYVCLQYSRRLFNHVHNIDSILDDINMLQKNGIVLK